MWVLFDNLKRQIHVKHELKHLLLKGLSKNTNTSHLVHHLILFRKAHLIRMSSRIQHRNRCVVSGRNWNVINKARYSRFVFRKESYEGNMPGLKRASW